MGLLHCTNYNSAGQLHQLLAGMVLENDMDYCCPVLFLCYLIEHEQHQRLIEVVSLVIVHKETAGRCGMLGILHQFAILSQVAA